MDHEHPAPDPEVTAKLKPAQNFLRSAYPSARLIRPP